MNCSGNLIPNHRRSIQTRSNPHYGNDQLSYLGVNTIDEFIVEDVYIETGWICEDCKKEWCNNGKS